MLGATTTTPTAILDTSAYWHTWNLYRSLAVEADRRYRVVVNPATRCATGYVWNSDLLDWYRETVLAHVSEAESWSKPLWNVIAEDTAIRSHDALEALAALQETRRLVDEAPASDSPVRKTLGMLAGAGSFIVPMEPREALAVG